MNSFFQTVNLLVFALVFNWICYICVVHFVHNAYALKNCLDALLNMINAMVECLS